MTDEAVVLFTKVPELGRVKTRLLSRLNPGECLALYRAMLHDALDELLGSARARGARPVLFFSSPLPDGGRDLSREGRITLVSQKGNDLGERLLNAFRWGFDRDCKRIVIFGGDIPAVTRKELNLALDALHRSRGVLGPAADGGYYLVGLSSPWPELFAKIRWSTSSVFKETLKQAGKERDRIEILPILPDLDTPEDLNRLIEKLNAMVSGCPRCCGPRLQAFLSGPLSSR